MDKNVGWELYRSFLSVMQEGSLSAAARSLNLTQPTVGRHIAALEKTLKLTLFVRSQGGLLPTDAANALRIHAEAMANNAAAFERVAASQGDGIQGVVRITASDVIGVEVLPTLFAELRQVYPRLRLELVLSNKAQDLLHREADIAIRMFRPKQQQLVARKVGMIEVGLHAEQAYLNQYGIPEKVADLSEHALIGFDLSSGFVKQALNAMPVDFQRDMFALKTDSNLAQLALIRAGAGIGFCQVRLGYREPKLIRVLAGDVSFDMETWITMHEDLRNSASCRVVFEALVQGMQDYLK